MISCVHAPNPTIAEINTADYGPYPSNYEEAIKSILAPNLKDPYSAVYNLNTPKKVWNNMTGETIFGWGICGTINAKNSFGGYVGPKPLYVMIKNDKIVIFLYRGITIPDSFKMGTISGFMEKSGSSSHLCGD